MATLHMILINQSFTSLFILSPFLSTPNTFQFSTDEFVSYLPIQKLSRKNILLTQKNKQGKGKGGGSEQRISISSSYGIQIRCILDYLTLSLRSLCSVPFFFFFFNAFFCIVNLLLIRSYRSQKASSLQYINIIALHVQIKGLKNKGEIKRWRWKNKPWPLQ